MPQGPRLFKRCRDYLLPPVLDAHGRDVWPVLNRALREQKWRLNGDPVYLRLLYPTPLHQAGVVIGMMLPVIAGLAVALLWVFYWIDHGGLSTSRGINRLAIFGPMAGAALTGSALAVLAFACWFRRVARRRITPGYVANGFCGACLYKIDAPPQGDGLTVCPECGSAWRTRPGGPKADPA